MNYWTELSIIFANQRNYLDELFSVYPTIPEKIRDISNEIWIKVEQYYNKKDNKNLLKELFKLELFPIKDSYVAYLKKDRTALDRNPETVNRLCGRLYEMNLNEIWEKCSEPKETNRQIGSFFRRWLQKKTLGVDLLPLSKFKDFKKNSILDGSDSDLLKFAKNYLNYNGDKGLDFLARFNKKFIVGEAKFLTDNGGHQNAQFEDAKRLLNDKSINAIKIGILDGVLYIKANSKMHNFIVTHEEKFNIMSALVLREFLYQV